MILKANIYICNGRRKTLRCIAPRLPRRCRGARLDVFYGAPHRHAIPEVNRRYRFCFRPNRVQVNLRVARHVVSAEKLVSRAERSEGIAEGRAP